MRKITNEAVESFKTYTPFRSSNTEVQVYDGKVYMYLFGNCIAQIHIPTRYLFISTCGWESNTTKERLNGILKSFNLPLISQKDFKWYIEGEEWKTGTKGFYF